MIQDISGDNKEKREEHLGVIVNETDRLTLLVNDILDLSKMEAGTVTFDMDNFNLSQTVKNIYEKFRVFSEFKNYNFITDCPDNVITYGNEKRITQVIYNLIGNAVNYTGDDNTVEIKVEKKEKTVSFQVTDTGKGISKEDIERVWNRYYKVSKTNSREANGSGIGLAIVKNILEIHNVDYGIISQEGKGATFWFELPLGETGNEEN
jgi:signal transduction histidine kinase